MLANGPPSLGSAGLETIFSSAAVEEAGSSGGVVTDCEFWAAAEELAVQDLGLWHVQEIVLWGEPVASGVFLT